MTEVPIYETAWFLTACWALSVAAAAAIGALVTRAWMAGRAEDAELQLAAAVRRAAESERAAEEIAAHHAQCDGGDEQEETEAVEEVEVRPRGRHRGPCQSLTTDPYYAGGVTCELYCEHPDGDGHTGRHTAHDDEVEWDDDGDTWVRGERI